MEIIGAMTKPLSAARDEVFFEEGLDKSEKGW
jgi:hypothetical protein